jgi:hypothetical protein
MRATWRLLGRAALNVQGKMLEITVVEFRQCNRLRQAEIHAATVHTEKGVACKLGGRAPEVVELTSGDLSVVCREITTKDGAIHPDRAREVSRGRSTHESGEGLNGPAQGG